MEYRELKTLFVNDLQLAKHLGYFKKKEPLAILHTHLLELILHFYYEKFHISPYELFPMPCLVIDFIEVVVIYLLVMRQYKINMTLHDVQYYCTYLDITPCFASTISFSGTNIQLSRRIKELL